MPTLQLSPLAKLVWDSRYRHRSADGYCEADIEETLMRVAGAVASVEEVGIDSWKWRFFDFLHELRFLPGGRILAGAGTGRQVTLCNCFVMGAIEDSVSGIFESLRQSAITLQKGGGIGCDFSTLRPACQMALTTGRTSSGPVSFMRIWDSMCEVIATGSRRGAMMGMLRASHPDIEAFIAAKSIPGVMSHFNLSVLVERSLIQAVREGHDFHLYFPAAGKRQSPGKPVSAVELWSRIMQSAYSSAEPGVVFIDRINEENNLFYAEQISAVNPCGELPLPPYGACVLGSLNLPLFIRSPFLPQAEVDLMKLKQYAALAVRFLDDTLQLSHYPLSEQRAQALQKRRIGLGITGLADALVMLGLRYDSADGLAMADRIMSSIADAAYQSSIELAQEKGSFPVLDRKLHTEGYFIRQRPPEIRQDILVKGIRNSHLLSIAPAGSISLLADNVSSGLEPIFAHQYTRTLHGVDGVPQVVMLTPYSLRRWEAVKGGVELPVGFVTANAISPEAQLHMQAALQRHVDNAISKTVAVPKDIAIDAFQEIYLLADRLGLKGCTAYRATTRGEGVLTCTKMVCS